MKVAIVHDILIDYGGAERVLEVLMEMFPKADLYTFFYNFNNQTIRRSFDKYQPKFSILQFFPWTGKLGRFFSVFKPLAFLYFYRIDFSKYDLVISSSGSYNAKFLRTAKSAHICYLHTPPKYLYSEEGELGFINRFPLNIVLFPLLNILKKIDEASSAFPDYIIANSNTVLKRVKKYYGKKSIVIYPPVEIPEKFMRPGIGKYYVAHSRLVRQKGIELIVETATKLNLPLKVIGEGYLKEKLEKISGPSVEFLGRVKDAQIRNLYRHAIALLYCPIDEDFGIVPIESMGYGIPVVAYKSGGVSETVIDKKTGVLFETYSQEGLYNAIKKLNSLKINSMICYENARKFRKEKFTIDFANFVRKVLTEF